MLRTLTVLVLAGLIAIPLGAQAQPHRSIFYHPNNITTTRTQIPTSEKYCAWQYNDGTSFGQSGQCRAGSAAVIGSSCTCEWTREHAHIVRDGKVIEIQTTPGTDQVVR